MLLCCIILAITLLYLRRSRKTHFHLLLLLLTLFVLCLAPAVVSIRLEQRWLQAPSAVFVLMLVILLSDLEIKGRYTGVSLQVSIAILFIVTDYHYLDRGGEYIYMSYSESQTLRFREATDKGLIRPATRRLFIYEQKPDHNNEEAIRWDLADGGFFRIYQNGTKQLLFGDSLYRTFNDRTDQLLFLNEGVYDVTGYFLKDSLKTPPAFMR